MDIVVETIRAAAIIIAALIVGLSIMRTSARKARIAALEAALRRSLSQR